MRKGVTKQAQIEAGIKAKAAGIEINEFYMPGMGGGSTPARAPWTPPT